MKDTGIGIPSEQIDNIFNVFSQGKDPLSGITSGAGIGLSVSKKLIELLDGEIWVESVEGKGSTFYFTIPSTSTP